MRRTVLIVSKAPRPGRSKTRLVPPLTPEQAAELHRALLLDTLDACRAEVPETGLLCPGADAAPLRALAGPATPIVVQEGRGLADALAGAVRSLVADGPVALVSSDVPGVPRGSLTEAFAALDEDADVVLGPAHDGGYWLIAMREFHAEPFRDVPWSTPAVLATTLERCRDERLRVGLLERWRDVDTSADLGALAEPGTPAAARTARFLRELVASGAIEPEEAPPLRLRATELLAESPWRSTVRDELFTRAGAHTSYAYLACPRAVFVVPVTDAGELVLVRQYRHPVRDWTLEVPAGTVDEGETPLEAARRELAEEAGGHARSWEHLSAFYSSSAHISLRSDAFLATGVELAAPNPGEDEDVSVVLVPVQEAVGRARAGRFQEGQTALAILLAAHRLE